MKSLIIFPSQDTPDIQFNANGELSIKGISVPENVQSFYKDVLLWLEEFKNSLPAHVNLNLAIEYMNTSSVKMIVSILQQLIKFCNPETKLTINWICDTEDEELIEEGEMLQETLNFPFNFILDESEGN